MENVRFVGLDVHADSISIAVASPGRDEPAPLATIPHDVPTLLKRLRRLGAVRCCYEAGPTGFGLQRALAAAGIECIVVAPSLVPVRAGDRVKTDRRDAVRLARFLRSGDLVEVHVPSAASEAMRDLERARDDAKRAELAARHQLARFLLRHGRRYGGGKAWTKKHHAWLLTQRFDHPAQQCVFDDYLKAVDDLKERVAHLTKRITDFVESWERKPLVHAFEALRGISTLSAVILAAEVDNFARFDRATKFMAYTGLVPSERSSGEERRQGPITRTGNQHVRRILIESAWAYRYRPALSERLRARNRGVADGVRRIAWRAQTRLCGRFRQLLARGKNANKAITAVARELAGFVWAIAREEKLVAS
jgi:transposase